MGKWNFLYEYGDEKRVYACSKCGSTITVDGELAYKMNGEKFCYNCGEIMNDENDKKEDFRKLTDELIERMAKAESKAEQYKMYAEDLDKQNKTLVEQIVKLEREKERLQKDSVRRVGKQEMNMNKEQTEKALIILEHYGAEKQRRQLVEECAELIQAVTKLERAQESGDVGKITEKTLELVGELVDVRIMLQQITMSLFQDVSKNMIYEQIEYKLQRQLDRIERERTGKNEANS